MLLSRRAPLQSFFNRILVQCFSRTVKFDTVSRHRQQGQEEAGRCVTFYKAIVAPITYFLVVFHRFTGNFTVMQKSSVAPTISEERSAEYDSLELLVENQAFLPRALQHPLNSRRAPTVSVSTNLCCCQVDDWPQNKIRVEHVCFCFTHFAAYSKRSSDTQREQASFL